jgi:transposase-like protein
MAIIFRHRRAYTRREREIVLQVLAAIRGMSSSAVARECGLVNSTVSSWRTRRTKCPSMPSVLKVAAALGLTVRLAEADDDTRTKRRGQNEARPRLN